MRGKVVPPGEPERRTEAEDSVDPAGLPAIMKKRKKGPRPAGTSLPVETRPIQKGQTR